MSRDYGLTPREQEIMDLHDAGRSNAQIVRRLSTDAGYVAATIRNYAFASCWSNSARFERKVRASDRLYVAALAAAGYAA